MKKTENDLYNNVKIPYCAHVTGHKIIIEFCDFIFFCSFFFFFFFWIRSDFLRPPSRQNRH